MIAGWRLWGWTAIALVAGLAETAILGSTLGPSAWREDLFLLPRLLGPWVALRRPLPGWGLLAVGNFPGLLFIGILAPLALAGFRPVLEMGAGLLVQAWATAIVANGLK